jgi:transcriptional regulator with XRE-family HTH domain
MFKDELKRARLSASLTQRALSDLTGIPLGSIKNWERGNYLPSVQSWEKLYECLRAKAPRTNPLYNAYYDEKVKKYDKE